MLLIFVWFLVICLHWGAIISQAGELSTCGPATVRVKILSINDFHGQLGAGRKVGKRPVGSAPVLAAYLGQALKGWEGRSFLVHAGDQVGASPAVSALLQDEPAIMFMNLLGNKHCSPQEPLNPRCNLVATVGNHEFDRGVQELQRLIHGGNHSQGPFLEDPYQGAAFPYVAANVVSQATGVPIFPPYVIKRVQDVPVAFIGAVVQETPHMVMPAGVAGLEFLDEAEAINCLIPELKAQKVRTVVVLLHQGGKQTSYQGPTRPGGDLKEPIVDIVKRLDDEVDVVISGHRHAFTNALIKTQTGKDILVTQAWAYGTAYGDIELEIDVASQDVVAKSAKIVTTYADRGPGLSPDPAVAQLVAAAEKKVAPRVNQKIAQAAQDIDKTQNAAGESALGSLIAEAQRAAMGSDFAFMNPGGIRADIAGGEVTWGELFMVQPFNNHLVKMRLTGQQIYDLLNQQWPPHQPYDRILQIAGLSYTWDNLRPGNDRIVEVRKDGRPIDKQATYTVTVNSYLAVGKDRFSVFAQGTHRVMGPKDLEALVSYLRGLPQPFVPPGPGRIERLN